MCLQWVTWHHPKSTHAPRQESTQSAKAPLWPQICAGRFSWITAWCCVLHSQTEHTIMSWTVQAWSTTVSAVSPVLALTVWKQCLWQALHRQAYLRSLQACC